MAPCRRLLIFLVIGILLIPMTAANAEWSTKHDQAPIAAPGADFVVLNELMPKAGSGGFEWVELFNSALPYRSYVPTVLRSFTTSASSAALSPAVQPSMLTTSPLWVDISGWQLTDGDGNAYTIPDALPPLPPGAFVLIVADGQGAGADDYDLSDRSATLHTPASLVGIFADAADQAALYDSSTHSAATLRDFVAWGGDPGAAADDAVTAGVWPSGAYLEFAATAGYLDESAGYLSLYPDESVGRYAPEGLGWAVYRDGQLSPGAPNPVPLPGFFQPEDGGAVDAATVVIGWSAIPGASGYRFQLSASPTFETPLVDVTSPYPDYHHEGALAPGAYYWRARVDGPVGRSSGWTAPARFDAVDLTPVATASVQAEKTLGIVWQVQHKDTYLLDVSPEGEDTRTGDGAWDAPHPDGRRVAEHDNHYCQVASMSMIASYYGGDISQDRLSYYAIRECPGSSRGLDPDRICTDPENCMPDVKDDFWAGRNKGLEAAVWMLGYTWDDYSALIREFYNPPTTTIPFGDIRGWIDAGRPLLVMTARHAMVVDGYRTSPINQVHLLDPWTAASWKPYTDTLFTERLLSVRAYPPQGTPPAPRSDEASVWTDSDGDGVYDFDEIRRFHTDPFDPDSDGDWVRDKDDIEETVFDSAGAHVYTPEYADWDGDRARKELDLDNDNDGAPDGCEDTNLNGIYQVLQGETFNFDDGDSQACVPRFAILYPLEEDPANAGDPTAPDKILVQVGTAVPDGYPLSLSSADFTVEIGGDLGTVISVYPSSDTYWLVVDPPDHTAGSYDLAVSLDDQSATEPHAVTYLTSRPNSSVLVLDRSGSMSVDGKMEAAQNAASAFIDVLNDGDEVGVVSFSDDARIDFGLSLIVDANVREDAIEAVDALTPLGMTALGQGAKAGYAEVVTGAHDNRWSLVLLSDGYENVEPYWNEVSPGITEAVVHTVALGEDAQRGLLAQIAGEKHGSFFIVDVEPPTAASASALTADPVVLAATLPNRLADAYLTVGDLELNRQRQWEIVGIATELRSFSVVIEPGLAEAVFTLNWETPESPLRLGLIDPDGNTVTPNAELFSDTHHQLRVRRPVEGKWVANVLDGKQPIEYHFALSAKSATTLIAAVGGDPQSRGAGEAVPIYGILSDHKPIPGAAVYALVAGPPGTVPETLQLYDDGFHNDGLADDGLYANETVPKVPGGYSVKLRAEGKNNAGVEFRRYAQTAFHVRYRAAYLWDDDIETAHDYAKLMQSSDWIVDLIHLSHVKETDFNLYALIVVGYDTGYGYAFDDRDAAGALAQWDAPILGLGDGGAALFAEYELEIGFGDSDVSSSNIVAPFAPTSSYWSHPYGIDTATQKLVTLYRKPLYELGIYLPKPIPLVTPIAREQYDETHYPVISEQRETGRVFTLWGYNLGPQAMTPDGRSLLVNVTHAMR